MGPSWSVNVRACVLLSLLCVSGCTPPGTQQLERGEHFEPQFVGYATFITGTVSGSWAVDVEVELTSIDDGYLSTAHHLWVRTSVDGDVLPDGLIYLNQPTVFSEVRGVSSWTVQTPFMPIADDHTALEFQLVATFCIDDGSGGCRAGSPHLTKVFELDIPIPRDTAGVILADQRSQQTDFLPYPR